MKRNPLLVSVAESRGPLGVVAVGGELDVSTAGNLHAEVTALLSDHPDMILDLSGVTFCDSSGFNALLRIRRRIRETDGWLVLAAPPPHVGGLLALSGADEVVFDVYPSREKALTAYEGR